MQGNTRQKFAVTALVGMCTFLLAGCSSGGPDAAEKVSKAEYLAGVQAAAKCIEEAPILS